MGGDEDGSKNVQVDIGCNNSGKYQLSSVLTHEGMYADGGHYIAWVRHVNPEDGSIRWFKYDDDKVSVVSLEEVLKLSGGGQTHCAYLCLYSPLLLEKTDK